MARGSEGKGDLAMFFMNIKGLKKGETVHITQAVPTEEKGKYTQLENTNSVEGDLVDITTVVKEFDGKSKEEIKLWLKDQLAGDKGELYVVTCGMNSIGRNIINNLASIDGPIGTLKLSVYMNRTSGMPSLYMEHNGQKLGWKYQWEELSQYVKKTTKKTKDAQGKTITVTENDNFELDEFLLGVLKEKIVKNIDPNKKLQAKTQPSPAPVAETAGAENDSDDLPF